MTQPRRFLWFAVAEVLLLAGLPIAGRAQTQVTPNMPPPLTGTTIVVNNGPGDHSDPHISGNTVSYSNSDGTNFTLGNGNSGIDLSTQDVTLQLVEDHGPGNFSITIPGGQGPGHFQNDGHGECVFFETINGVQLAAGIGPFSGSTCQSANSGPYSYGFAGQGANNLPSTNTVTVTLTVGNNSGSKSVNAFFQTSEN